MKEEARQNEIRDRLLNALEWLEEIKGSTSSDENYENADIIQKFIKCYQTEINRQKSEIERLQKAIKVQDIMIEQQDYKIKSKSEVIKEFAERLKKLDVNTRMLYSSVVYELGEDDIDNLVKEMTEPVKIEHNSLCETETYTKE